MSPQSVKAFALLRSAVIATGFFALQAWYLPHWFGVPVDREAPRREPARLLGALPALAGAALMLACVWRFGAQGEGTPAPFDPPRRLVVRGPYRYVRNPMYWGMGLFLLGEAALFADASVRLVLYGAALVTAVNLFLRLYEEPSLRRRFGEDYARYCSEVGRWIPRRPRAGGPR